MNKAMTNESLPIINNRFYQEFQVHFGMPIIMTDFSISRKHRMDYVTVDGIILRTGYSNKRAWYHLCITKQKEQTKMKSNTNKISNQHDVDRRREVQPNESDIYMSNQHKNSQTPLLSAPTAPVRRRKGPVATSTKQMAGYFTVSGIENEISLTENEWPCFALKELSDNAYDWLNDYYPITTTNNRHTINSGSSSNKNNNSRTRRYISIRIQIDQIPHDADLTRIFRIAVPKFKC